MAKKMKRKTSSGLGTVNALSRGIGNNASPAEFVSAPVAAGLTAQRFPSIRRPGVPAAATEFNPDYTPIVSDLKRIAVLAVSFVVLLVVLSFVL